MRLNFLLSLMLCITSVTMYAQDDQLPLINIGDKAPALRVSEWIKGNPVDSFEKGKIYVVEFWATWCAPCRAAIPHLSVLARKYKHKVTFIGMDIYEHFESANTALPEIKKFVKSMGKRMNYNVAAEDSNFMETDWINAAGAKGDVVPGVFIINTEGRLAWIGSPEYLSSVLPKILNNTWNTKLALNARILNKKLLALDDSFYYELAKYRGYEDRGDGDTANEQTRDYIGDPDSALVAIDKIFQDNHELKYAPFIAWNTFTALLKTNLDKAYEYGKAAIITPVSNYAGQTYGIFDDPPLDAINDGVNYYTYLLQHCPDKIKFSRKIYELGAEAYQLQINHVDYPKISHISKYYNNMAACYWLANDKSKAIHAQRNAIKAIKKEQFYFSKPSLKALKLQLKQYKKNRHS